MTAAAVRNGVFESKNPPGLDSCLCGMLCTVILVIALGITLKLTIHRPPSSNTPFIGP